MGFLARQVAQAEGHVVEDRQVREQREILEHQSDIALLRRHEARWSRHLLPVEQQASPVGLLDPRGDPQQRGLAAARRPQKAGDLAGMKLQAHIHDGRRTAKPLGDILELKQARKGGTCGSARAPALAVLVLGQCLFDNRHRWRGLQQFPQDGNACNGTGAGHAAERMTRLRPSRLAR